MEAYRKLWTDRLEPATSFVDAEYFEQHSSTLKIINGTFRNIFIGDSSEEDSEEEKNPYNLRKSSKNKTMSLGKRQVQMNKPKQLEKSGKPGFVPCFVDQQKMKYPKFSVLNEKEQALVVKLMEKYKGCYPKFPTAVEKAELQQLEALLTRVSLERIEFDNFTKIHCGRNHDRYTFIKPEVKKYIGERWKHKILQISRYPSCYESQTLLPLVYPATKDRIVLRMKQVLFQMGTAPVVHIPYLRKPLHVVTSYGKMCALHPPDKSLPYGNPTGTLHMPVSQDETAEKLAKMHNADVVISLSALKRIMNNVPPFNKEWDLPILVKEYTKEEQGRTTKAKVVFIDKALAPFHLTTVERSSWFYKLAVKNVLCREKNYRNISNEDYKDSPLVSIASQQVICESEVTDMISCDSDKDTRLNMKSSMSVKSMDELSEENAFNFETTISSKSPVKNNIHKLCTENTKKRKVLKYVKKNEDSDDDRLIMDLSDTEVSYTKKHKQEGDHTTSDDLLENKEACLNAKKFSIEKYKQSSDSRDTDEDSEDRMVIHCDMPDEFCEQKVASDAETAGTVHQQALNECNYSKNANSKGIVFCQDLELPFDSTVLEGRDRQKSASLIQDAKEIEKGSNMEENKDKNMTQGQSSALPLGRNVTYRLWELKPEENPMENMKDTFIKGEHPHHSFKIIVKTKVDGCEDDIMHAAAEDVRTLRVIPKLEYQCEFGAVECLTQDELFTQWAITLFNPGTKLIKVRLDPIRSEVMMFESTSSQEATQQLGAATKGFLSTLYSILQGFTELDPGKYLLSHNMKMGTFATLRRAESHGRYNLQSVYNFDPFAAPSYECYPWNPIDRNIITPFHRAYNRVPATFPPPSEKEITKRIMRKRKKRANKRVKKLNNSAQQAK